MDRYKLGVFVLLAVLEIAAIVTWNDDRTGPPPEGVSTENRAPTTLALLMTSAFLGLSALFVWKTSIDHFSQGALALVAILQLFAFVGWLGSTDRLLWHFYTIFASMAVLSGTVLLSHAMQREA